MKIKSFKLNSGEEVIAEVVDRPEGGGYTIVKNPVALHRMAPDADPSMISWFQIGVGDCDGNERTNRTFTFKNSHIFLEVEPLTNVKEIYEQQFGTGLVKPPSKIISAV